MNFSTFESLEEDPLFPLARGTGSSDQHPSACVLAPALRLGCASDAAELQTPSSLAAPTLSSMYR